MPPTDGDRALPEPARLPTLHAGSLALEPMLAAHADALFPLLVDPELYRYIDSPPPASLEHLRERFRRLESRRSPDGAQRWLNWAVRERAEGLVGFVQATVEPSGAARVAYVFGRPFWGRGYASRATACMLEHLAAAHGARRFLATVEHDNAPSVALLRRLGFEPATPREAAGHRLTPTERLFVRGAGPAPERRAASSER